MKKTFLLLTILFAVFATYANGEITEISVQTNDEPVEILIKGDFESGYSAEGYSYKPPRKSAFGAAMMSLVIPGAGELYATNWEQGWVNMAFTYVVYPLGIYLGAYMFNDFNNYSAFVLIWSIFEISVVVDSIMSSVRLAKDVNIKNGYVSMKVGKNTYLGLRPEISYNDNIPQSNNTGLFSAGVGLSLSF